MRMCVCHQANDYWGAGQTFLRTKNVLQLLAFYDFSQIKAECTATVCARLLLEHTFVRLFVVCVRGWWSSWLWVSFHEFPLRVLAFPQYLATLFDQMKELKKDPPPDMENHRMINCLFEWLVLATAILRVCALVGNSALGLRYHALLAFPSPYFPPQGKPKLEEVEEQLKTLRGEITQYTVNMKPFERDVSVCVRDLAFLPTGSL